MYLCIFLYLSLILIISILIILYILILIILIILGWSLRNRPKCRGLGETSAFGTGPRLEINIFVHFPCIKLNIDNININYIINMNINNIHNIGLEPQKPSQMQRSR